METGGSRLSWNASNEKSVLRRVLLVCVVAILSYLAAKLFGSALMSPQVDWPLWLGNVLLVSVLLLVPRRMWPILMAAVFAAYVLFDLQTGVTIRSTAWLILADTIEVLTAAFCLTYFFDGVPRLDSVKALAKYSFFAVILAPFIGAFLGALASRGNYWMNWRISFFSEALGFLTLMPAILGWVSEARAVARKSHAYYLEAAVLMAALILFGCLTFVVPARISPQALLYSLVPFLLWSALRFGSTGVSTSVIMIAFLAIWGATHGRGPFIELGPLNNVSSLQAFLFFTASPFMVLAALVEERRRTESALRESEARERARVKELETLLDAAPIPILFARDAECKYVTANRTGYQLHHVPIGANFSRSASPIEPLPFRIVRDGVEIPTEELPLQRAAATGMPVFGSFWTLLLEDGTEHHMIGNAAPLFDEDGKVRGAIGAFVDITDRKRAEEARRQIEEQHRIVVETATDAVVGSDENSKILFVNPATTRIFGYESSELIGQPLTMLMPEYMRKLHNAGLQRYLATGQRHMDWRGTELVGLRKNGEEFPVDVSFGEVREAGRRIFTGFVRDIGERKRSEEELRRLSGQLLRLQDEERRRIARDLHDSTGQVLVALATTMSQLHASIPSADRKLRKLASHCQALADQCIREVRTLSYLLHPPMLDEAGLGDAIRHYADGFAERTGIHVALEISPRFERMTPDVEVALFRVAQESLTNIHRHSGSLLAAIRIDRDPRKIMLEVSDKGSGISGNLRRRSGGLAKLGVGIPSMQERVKLIGGRLEIESSGSGTTVRVTIPDG